MRASSSSASGCQSASSAYLRRNFTLRSALPLIASSCLSAALPAQEIDDQIVDAIWLLVLNPMCRLLDENKTSVIA